MRHIIKLASMKIPNLYEINKLNLSYYSIIRKKRPLINIKKFYRCNVAPKQ
jgi:hypothetical protein